MRMFSTLNAAFWSTILGVIALFAFFIALGAVNPAEATVATLAVGALVVLYVAHAMWTGRRAADGRDPDSIRQRERRGF